MQIFHDIQQWQAKRRDLSSSLSLGFAPTMGNLHVGHLSLFQQSLAENDCTVASIFVNPTQFNHPEDFKHYPRTLEQDLALLEQAGVDYCLLPTEEALYADGYTYTIQENLKALKREGQCRPGHFTGMLTIVMKLLQLAAPNRAYFGEKDYQQYLLICNMVKAFFMPVNIRLCSTIREPSGLAYSSRNNRLTAEEKTLAQQFAKIFHQDKPCAALKAELIAAGIDLEYLEQEEDRLYVAVYIGKIRLIDNKFYSACKMASSNAGPL